MMINGDFALTGHVSWQCTDELHSTNVIVMS